MPHRIGPLSCAAPLLAAGVALLASSVAVGGAAPASRGEARLERRLAAMGTELGIELAGADRGGLLAASEAAAAAVAAAEARLSTWGEEGELARLNRQPAGLPLPLSEALAAELAAAWACRERTGGAFEPALGPLVAAWDLRAGGRRPRERELAAARAASGARAFQLGPGPAATRLHPGAALEEGGFGKGAGLDRAADALTGRVAFARLDLGGQVLLVGDGRPVELAVAGPRERQRAAVALRIEHGSLATSGNSERGGRPEGRPVGHLLDPRTGRPAPDFGSVTVWAPSALAADCLSTGLFVLGPAGALAFAERDPEVGVLVLEPAGAGVRARVAGALRGRVHPLRAGVRLEELSSAPLGPAQSPSSLPPSGAGPTGARAAFPIEGAVR